MHTITHIIINKLPNIFLICISYRSGSGCVITYLARELQHSNNPDPDRADPFPLCIATDINPNACALTALTAKENKVIILLYIYFYHPYQIQLIYIIYIIIYSGCCRRCSNSLLHSSDPSPSRSHRHSNIQPTIRPHRRHRRRVGEGGNEWLWAVGCVGGGGEREGGHRSISAAD